MSLNGCTLRPANPAESIITVESSGVLDLEDSSQTKSGLITGGQAAFGSAIYNLGTVNLKDIKISGNTSSYGAVYQDGVLNLGRNVTVAGNRSKNGESNVFLPNGKYVSVLEDLPGTVGITVKNTLQSGKSVAIAAVSALPDVEKCFVSDAGYAVLLNDGWVYLKAAESYFIDSGSYTPKAEKWILPVNDETPAEFTLFYIENGAKLTESEAQSLIIRINGKIVDAGNYSVRMNGNGDIIIEFTAAFIQTLEKGEYVLSYEFAKNNVVLLAGKITLIVE